MTSDAAERDTGARAVDGGTSSIDRGADDRPLVYDLSTAEVVREALAALRRDRLEPLDDALVPGMHFPPDRRVLDNHLAVPHRAGIRAPRGSAWLRLHRPGPVEAGHSGGDQPGAPSLGVVVENRTRRRQRLGVPLAWLAAGAGLVVAVGIALLAVTVINQQDLEGRQPGGQVPVTAELDNSRQFAPGGGQPPAGGPSDRATAGAGSASATAGSATGSQGPAPGSPAPTAGTLVAPTVVSAGGPPTVGGQQPAVISTLAAGDQGFGWPSSAFGTAGG